AIECYTVGLGAEAMSAAGEAVALRRALGDPLALGVTLRWLSRIAWWAGDRDLAESAGKEAVAVLSQIEREAGPAGPGTRAHEPALALALSNRSQLLALAGRREEAIEV